MNKKTILIIGTNSSIGYSIAKSFAVKNYDLIITSKNSDKLAETASNLSSYSKSVKFIAADFNNPDDINSLIQFVKKSSTQLDVIINAAGVYHNGDKAFSNMDFVTYSDIDVQNILTVGIQAPMIIFKNLVSLIPQYGKIVNISGTFEAGAKGWLPYYVSKKALETCTIGLSHELIDKKIQVNCISPSDTLTDSYKKYFPEYALPEKCLDPDEISDLIFQIISNDNLNGQIIELTKN